MHHKGVIHMVAALLAVVTACLMGGAPAGAEAPPTFEAAACPFTLPALKLSPETRGFECGYVTVPERHAQPDGATIRIPVAILRAKGDNRQPEPLFMAQGGPGGDAFQVFSLTMADSPLADTRDIVIFNQRGTMYAEPDLRCTEVFDQMDEFVGMSTSEAMPAMLDAYGRCHNRLREKGVDLSAFNSLENASDVDSIRQALGYHQINFYGVSYGTLLGLHLMRLYPDHLRAVILDGVVPPQYNFVEHVAEGTDRVLTRLFDACRADAGCNADFPDLETRFFALIDRLDESPVTIPLTDPETGRTVDAYMDGRALMDVVFQLLYAPDAYATFPRLVSDLDAGDYHSIQELYPMVVFDRTMSEGMYYSVICSEDADIDLGQVPLQGLRPQIAKYALDDIQEGYLDVCARWPVELLPPSVDDPVVSEVPILLLSGEFDPITPPSNADMVAQGLPNSFVFTYPGGSHGVMGLNPCVDSVVMDFLDVPTMPPDPTCLDSTVADEFVPADAIHLPLVLQVGSLQTGAMVRLAIAALCLFGVLSAFVVWPAALLVRLAQHKTIEAGKGWMRAGRFATFAFGLLAMVYIAGLSAFLWQVMNDPMINLSMVPHGAAVVLAIPWLLAVLALAMGILAVIIWVRGAGVLLGRLYFTFLTVCAIGYVLILAIEGTLTALLR